LFRSALGSATGFWLLLKLCCCNRSCGRSRIGGWFCYGV